MRHLFLSLVLHQVPGTQQVLRLAVWTELEPGEVCTTPPPRGPQAAAHAHSFPSPPAGGPLSCEFSLTQESQALTPQLPAHPSSPKLPHKALRRSTWAILQAPHQDFRAPSRLFTLVCQHPESLAPGLTMLWCPGLPVFPQSRFLLWGLPHSLEGSPPASR